VGTVDAPTMPTGREAQVQRAQPPQDTLQVRPSVSGGVPFRNPHFTGREVLLARLRERLRGGSSQLALLPHALHGMGGVGKTHLAAEYAWRFESEYDLIWWIPAESPTTVRTSLVALAEAIGVAAPGQETDKTISAVLEALRLGQPYARWLLVYDNAKAPEDLAGLLPVPSGHVIITSRDPEWSRQAALLEVDVFDRAESVALLQRRGAGIGAEEAQTLAEMLGDLPLALDQAAAWQAATGTPAAELARLLGERMQELLNDPPGGRAAESGTSVGVLATWDLAFTELRSRSPGAARLLEVLAFFGADPIAIPILRDGRGAELPDDLARVVGDDLMLRRAIRDIGRFALAKVDPAGNRVEVHRLVQSVLRGRLTEQQAAATRDAVHRIIGAANSGYPDVPRTHERHQELLPHITPSGVIAGASRAGQLAALDQIRYRFNKGFYSSSVSLGENAVNTWRERLGPDDELTLIAQRHLAIALRELGEYRRAAQLNQDTLARLREVFGEDHEHTLATMNSINRDLRLQARFEEARAFDEDCVARHVARFGEDDQETVRARNNLAVDLRMLGRGEEALLLDQATYAMAVNVFGRDHESTLGSLANLGRDLTDSGRYAEAVQLLTDAARRARDTLGAWHRITHRAELNLVIVLRRSGEVERARGLAEELQARVREQLRPGHETLLSTIVTYANALLAAGEAPAARDYLAEALQGYQESFGHDHPFTQVAAVDLAVALRTTRDHRRARELDEQALASLTAAVGLDHPYTLVAQINLAHDLALADQLDRARELSGEAYGRSRRVRGDDRPETMVCGLNHALDLQAIGDETQGSELLTQVRAQLQDRYGADHPAARAVAVGRRAESDVEHWDS
jgi:tetratricopeptide (TPR) repeat protein